MSTTAFPVGGRSIIDRMIAKFPELFVNVDEIQLELTRRINAQFAFTFGNKWGGKVRTGLDPVTKQSKDSQAVLEDDGTISIWDMFSAGLEVLVNDGQLPKPGTHANQSPSVATFIPTVPRDWLEGTEPQPQKPCDEYQPAPNGQPDGPEHECFNCGFPKREHKGQEPEEPDDLEPRVASLERQVIDLQGTVATLHANLHGQHLRLMQLEADVAKPRKVTGKTESTWGHQHTINLEVR